MKYDKYLAERFIKNTGSLIHMFELLRGTQLITKKEEDALDLAITIMLMETGLERKDIPPYNPDED